MSSAGRASCGIVATISVLTGKYKRGEKPAGGSRLSLERNQHWLENADWDLIEALTLFGAERGHSLLDVAIAGLAARPAVTSVIAGATTPEQVAANVTAAGWALSREDMDEIDRITAK